jgi:hypothetical protein
MLALAHRTIDAGNSKIYSHANASEAPSHRPTRLQTGLHWRYPKYKFCEQLDRQHLIGVVRVKDRRRMERHDRPPASHSPSGLYDMACQAVLLIGSLNLRVGSSSCSRNSRPGLGEGYVGRLNWRSVRSDELVTSRLDAGMSRKHSSVLCMAYAREHTCSPS